MFNESTTVNLPTTQKGKTMKGIEAKYTAKHIAKMIKRNRDIHRNSRRFYETRKDSLSDDANIVADKYAIANFVEKETKRLSLEFRAYMIHNAYMKNRSFSSAETEYHNLGDNAIETLKEDKPLYSRYVDRRNRQQKAINIVKHTLLDKSQITDFNRWIENTA